MHLCTVDTRRHFNADTTSCDIARRRIDVETTSCVYWMHWFSWCMNFLRKSLLSIKVIIIKAYYPIKLQGCCIRDIFWIDRSSQWRCSVKNVKACNFIKKETLAQVFSCECYKTFKYNFFLYNTSGGCFWIDELIFTTFYRHLCKQEIVTLILNLWWCG